VPSGREIFGDHFCELRHQLHRRRGDLDGLDAILDREYASKEEFLLVFDAWLQVADCQDELKSLRNPRTKL
jgi:hypothetical protein